MINDIGMFYVDKYGAAIESILDNSLTYTYDDAQMSSVPESTAFYNML